MSELPDRKNPSPGVHIDLSRTNFILLTVTTHRRLPWLADKTIHRLLHETWAESKAWLVSDYLLMPDHLHCFCAPYDLQIPLETWITFWKRQFSVNYRKLTGKVRPPDSKFQARGWHHRLRNSENYSEKWLYVQENPVRKGLCKHIDDWPYKGRIFDLVWTGK